MIERPPFDMISEKFMALIKLYYLNRDMNFDDLFMREEFISELVTINKQCFGLNSLTWLNKLNRISDEILSFSHFVGACFKYRIEPNMKTFYVSYLDFNAIGNLKGSPKEVQHFSALGTALKSFEGCPEIVHGDFDFSNLRMNIEDFDFTYFPKHVGGMISMWFADNHLKCDKTNFKQMIISHCGNSNIVI